jgi:imidazolonepropionase-like amidohydrolase
MTELILKNFDLLDVREGKLLAGYQLLIRGATIARVEKGAIEAASAEVVDLGGRVLMPGLIDCHVHLNRNNFPVAPVMLPSLSTAYASETLRSMLMRGFTTVRDAAGADFGHKQAIELGLFVGPRLFAAGRAISQTGGHGDPRSPADTGVPCPCSPLGSGISRIADGETEVRRAVRDEIRLGADHIKVMAGGGVATLADPIDQEQYSFGELQAAVDEARRANRYVMAHVYTAAGIRRCIEAGIRTIEHGSFLDEDTARMMVAAGAYLSPNLLIYHIIANEGKALGYADVTVSKAKEVLEVGSRAIDIARKVGLKMSYSTDLSKVPHRQDEEFIVRSEILPNDEIIRSATLVGAEIVQMPGKVGEIAENAHADLIAVDGNPLEDIRLLTGQGRHLSLIMKEGKIFKRSGV